MLNNKRLLCASFVFLLCFTFCSLTTTAFAELVVDMGNPLLGGLDAQWSYTPPGEENGGFIQVERVSEFGDGVEGASYDLTPGDEQKVPGGMYIFSTTFKVDAPPAVRTACFVFEYIVNVPDVDIKQIRVDNMDFDCEPYEDPLGDVIVDCYRTAFTLSDNYDSLGVYNGTPLNGIHTMEFIFILKNGVDYPTSLNFGIKFGEGIIQAAVKETYDTAPEPATVLLLGLGVAAIPLSRRFRTK